MRSVPPESGAAPLQSTGRGASHFLLLAAAPAAWLGLVALGVLVEPDPRGYGTHEQLGLPACLSMQLCGLPCPGCGVTTAVALAMRGRLAAAVAVQPFGLAVAFAAALYPLWAVAVHRRGRHLAVALGELLSLRGALLLLGLMLAAWIYKLVATI